MTSSLPPPGEGSKVGARVLVVDDEPAQRRTLARHLMARGFAVDTAEDGRVALDLLKTRRVDVILLDLEMPGMTGMDALARVRHEHPEVEVIALANLDGLDGAVRAVRAGAYDYLVKPLATVDTLSLVIERAVERRRLHERTRALEQKLEHHQRFGEIVGSSSAMQDVYRRANAAAATSSPVLILGESGTGKELVARAIYRSSRRSGDALRVVSCGAIAAEIAEAELFGDGARPGALELADGATVLLDDVGELPRAAQARLARVLSHGELVGAGGEATRVDVRVLATAGADLKKRVTAGEFREDLYYRLAVVQIHVPPLRQRREDIPLLAYHFVQKVSSRRGRDVRRISVEALRKLRDHDWTGNVRELEHAIEHAVVMARGDVILPADLPFGDPGDPGPTLVGGDPGEMPYPEAKERAGHTFDKTYVDRLMKRAGGNVSEAARLAGMDRSNFRRLLKKVRSK